MSALKMHTPTITRTTRRTFGLPRVVYVGRCSCGHVIETRTPQWANAALEAHRDGLSA